MDDRELEAQLLPKLVEVHGEPLDPNLLAAYADGALPPEEHAEVGRRIAADPDALLLVRALHEDRARARARTWSLAALAASVLVAVGFWWGGRGEDPATLDLQGRLEAAVATLAAEDGAAFGGFRLVDSEALRRTPSATRGGAAWLAPVGVLLEAPAELRWRNPPDATRAEVRLFGGGFSWKRQIDGERHAAPRLEPGRYVVRLRALDTLAGQAVRGGFEIATPARREAHERALATIRATASEDLAELLVAHYALGHRLFEVARGAALAARDGGGAIRDRADALLAHVDAVAAP